MTIATVARRHPALDVDPDAPSWIGAACVGYDPELWFHDDQTNTRALAATAEAKAICAVCPLRDTCLMWAIQQDIPFGVYGGMTRKEREEVGIRYCGHCHRNPIGSDSRAKYCPTCRPLVRARRGDKERTR